MTEILAIVNLVGLGGVAVFIYYTFRGLRVHINTLETMVAEQRDTLSAVRERADEFSRLSQGYKRALEDFQSMGEMLNDKRRELVAELEDANKRKDEQLIELRSLQLQELELKQKSLDAIPALETRLNETIAELDRRIKIIAPKPRRSSLIAALLASPDSSIALSSFARSPLAETLLSSSPNNKNDEQED